MTQVKICGLRRVEHALVAADAGASMLGFVFAPSPRRIEPERAAEIIATVRRVADIRTVGIFVNERAEIMNRLAGLCDLDYLQLSGDEPPDLATGLDRPVIKVMHVQAHDTPASLSARAGQITAPMLLLDTARAGSYGGTGEAFDWSVIPALGRPVLLAGGLHAGNVAQAILRSRPWGVDVSSGVETDGEKDPARIRAFVESVLRTAS